MLPLLDAAVVFGAQVLAEGVEDGLQRGGAAGGQVPVDLPRPAERGAQPQVPVVEPVLIPVVPVAVVGVGVLGLPRLGDGAGEDRQVFQRQPARRRHRAGWRRPRPACRRAACRSRRRSPSPRTRRCPRRSSPRRSAGAGPSRFCQPTAPLAAPLEIPVLLISQARADRCPSGSYPDCAVNADRTAALTAVSLACARCSWASISPCACVPSDAQSTRGQVIQRRVQHPGRVGGAGECRVRHLDHLPPGVRETLTCLDCISYYERISNCSTRSHIRLTVDKIVAVTLLAEWWVRA